MVVVQGCTLKVTNDAGGAATAQITTAPSTGVKAGSKTSPKEVYRGPIQIVVTAFEGVTITGGTGTGVMQPNVAGTTVDNLKPFKEGATASITCTGSLKQGTGTGTEVAVVQITDAGQSFIKFE